MLPPAMRPASSPSVVPARPLASRRLRIGFDAHVIGRRQTGNERVQSNLLRALRQVCDHELIAYFSDRDTAAAWERERLGIRTVVVRPMTPFVRIPISLPLLAARDRLDVMFGHVNVAPIAPCPMVALIHDVAFGRHPEYLSAYERTYMRFTIPASMRWAAAIVAVSHFTKDEICALYSIPPDRVTVAPNGVDAAFFDPPSHPCIEPPFFLAAGNLQPRKNLVTLVRAYRDLIDRRPDVRERLVLVGQPAHEAEALLGEAADLMRAGRVVLPGYLADGDLAGLYRVATAFAYPSVYEGFGLPPLEAMAAGAPALVADISVMREVAGDAAVRLPATDVNAWREGLERVLDDPSHRQGLVHRGKERARLFTWQEQARIVVGVLERAAKTRRWNLPRRSAVQLSTRPLGREGEGSSSG
jgi:glycosyltransferase involved in cell wall biosynthesis